MAVEPIPEGYTSVSPYLTVDDGKAAIDFYKRAFGATEIGVMEAPDGKIAHAALRIGNGVIMFSDPFPQFAAKSPKELGGTSVVPFLYVEDVDAVIRQAADAGATVDMQPEDQFWGDRMGQITDPFGHIWQIATHVEDVAPEEMERRSQEIFAAMAG
jgi:PhnB protein